MIRSYKFSGDLTSSYKVLKIKDSLGNERGLDRNTRIIGASIHFSSIAGAASATAYLHSLVSGHADGAVATTTHQKYTEPAALTISVDATDATKGFIFWRNDPIPFAPLDYYSLSDCGELHIKLNAGTASVRGLIFTET